MALSNVEVIPKTDQRKQIKKNILPLPLQYLGSKSRISDWILDEISNQNLSTKHFVDLFAGTGAVAFNAGRRGYKVYVNDIQPYAYCLNRSVFKEDKDDILKTITRLEKINDDDLLAGARKDGFKLLEEERKYFKQHSTRNLNWKSYKSFCESTPLVKGTKEEAAKLSKSNGWNLFLKYYSNTYFGVKQCLQLDLLRQISAENRKKTNWHLLAATISAMSYGVSSTTHLAQYLRPANGRITEHLIKRRSFDIVKAVLFRLNSLLEMENFDSEVYCDDFKGVLKTIDPKKNWIIYADPPYFKEHYSRYYHLLDTFYLYDYPTLTFNPRTNLTTEGRYREERIISGFGLKSKVKSEFYKLFEICKKSNSVLVLSYASTSLLSRSEIINIGKEVGMKAITKHKTLLHSGQGQPRNHKVTEFLFIFKQRQ